MGGDAWDPLAARHPLSRLAWAIPPAGVAWPFLEAWIWGHWPQLAAKGPPGLSCLGQGAESWLWMGAEPLYSHQEHPDDPALGPLLFRLHYNGP